MSSNNFDSIFFLLKNLSKFGPASDPPPFSYLVRCRVNLRDFFLRSSFFYNCWGFKLLRGPFGYSLLSARKNPEIPSLFADELGCRLLHS